jgi:ribonucleoside-diphosphate reductase alpha chain
MPASATVADIERVFVEAWRAGCKGITIYRDGSRTGVLVADASSGKKAKQHIAERPKVLQCDIHRVSVRGAPYLVLVGLADGIPYEVFAGEQSKIDLPKRYTSGTISRAGRVDGRMTYDLAAVRFPGDDPRTFHDIVQLFDNQNYGAMTRTISMILRCGCSTLELIETLRKDKYSDISSFSSGIARVIKQYVKDGTKLDAKCPECDQPALAYQGGCVTCTNCGHSKC